MKDEIKEILQSMAKIEFKGADLGLENKDLKILLDYITNLQKQNEILLKDRKKATDLFVDYKKRIDKATKLLKEAGCYEEESKQFCDDIWEELPDILSALEGSDNK